MSDALRELQALREELVADLMFCTTRDSHIRQSIRINRLDAALLQLEQSIQATAQ